VTAESVSTLARPVEVALSVDAERGRREEEAGVAAGLEERPRRLRM
jgi:hypothetical protein